MKKDTHIKRLLLASALIPSLSSAVTLSFGPAGAPQPIPGSGGITYTTTTVQGGTATAGTHNGSGTLSNTAVGGNYGGTFFSPLADPDNTKTTRIGSGERADIDNGIANNYANYVGLCVSFSQPIPMFGFGYVDLDGLEWVGSFAYNSTSMTTLAPAITRGDTTDMTMPTPTVNWSGLTGAPTSTPIVRDIAGGNKDPDDANGQVLFDYGGAMVTEIYFVTGVATAFNGPAGTVNNSGVTGFAVIEEATVIPEPSSAILFLTAIAACGFRRRR